MGNRTNADGRGYTVNNLNAYAQLTAPGQTLTYDANGNISSWGGTSFSHDSQGQLTNLTAGSQSTAYQYDYRRLRVTGGTAAYTYDAAGNLRQIADGGNLTQYVYVDGIDHAVLLRRNGTLYALITDHLGSVVAILNSAGNLVQSYDYTPFGRTTATGTDVGNVLGFTGREYDPASGLYYYRNRWYSPDLGRFLEPDPIGLAGWDVNLYRYVGNSPINATDPTGQNIFVIVIGAGLVIAGVIWAAYKIGTEYKKAVAKLEGSGEGSLEASLIPLKSKVVDPLVMEELKLAVKTPVLPPDGMKDLLFDSILKDPALDELLEKGKESCGTK